MKKWIDGSEIKMINELPTKELREVDKEMRKTPRFNKYIDKKDIKK